METGAFNPTLSISGEKLTKALRKRARMFDERFENTFQLKAKVQWGGQEREEKEEREIIIRGEGYSGFSYACLYVVPAACYYYLLKRLELCSSAKCLKDLFYSHMLLFQFLLIPVNLI